MPDELPNKLCETISEHADWQIRGFLSASVHDDITEPSEFIMVCNVGLLYADYINSLNRYLFNIEKIYNDRIPYKKLTPSYITK